MKRNLIKYFLIFLLLATGALIYVYAQKNNLFSSNEKKTDIKLEEQEQPEDIGVLTDDDPWKEIDKLVAAYYNMKGITYLGNIKLIDDNGDKEKILEEHKFQYSTFGRNMYYKLGSMEFVTKENLILVADHNNKFISVSRQNVETNHTKKLFDIGEFKKLMEQSKANAKITQSGTQKILTIENIKDPQIQGYRIYYDPLTYQINKMLIGMLRLSPLSEEEGGIEDIPTASDNNSDESKNASEESSENEIETYIYYLEIIYDKAEILNVTEKTFNPEAKFIKITGNIIELMPALSSYQLISNGNIQNEAEGTN